MNNKIVNKIEEIYEQLNELKELVQEENDRTDELTFDNCEYVKCIGLNEKEITGWAVNFNIGNIYKLHSTDNDGTISVKDNDYNFSYWCDKSQFAPSTKKEYDEQFKSQGNVSEVLE